ncbi:hypothetical protein KC332_g4672 [Hortaea werneckii]|uniref:HTH La-type RNA-binding domain-containing protein n=1 Tax=Hortaea werneckii TaxID=91943 RepID=A0A3M7IP88_HORWE|nr:hypothetical protein KC358_g5371 [Hortaea werneckii]KAI6845257.1 hypothetical protein KC350_g4514 [Hortaea werneckii]KAI6927991.1 hypothetical protein KC341_g11807 [Hortaea werneckii]KAI6937829.1 hypothetical protein KC348_g5626 [Hortaea werneckii]KAI6973498.1 hypothetical protein KC321_g5633 [Hortaea werneckii]
MGSDLLTSVSSTEHEQDSEAAVSLSAWTPPGQQQAEPHARAAEILRQVEYYFSDESLPGDSHLLGFTGRDGTKPVSLSMILSFKKMKQYRPKAAVREVLKSSSLVEVVDSNHIKRRYPLNTPLLVVPKVDEARARREIMLAANPHLTKNMLKSTGFEPDATEPPLTDAERSLYDPSFNFIDRIQTAVKYFASKRKMHQDLLQVFEKFLLFGGFITNVQTSQSGMSKEELKKQEGLTEAQAKELLEYYLVSDAVVTSISSCYEDQNKVAEFVVDFVGVAKGFLSSEFMASFDYYDEKMVQKGTQVLRSFYNYLLLHRVCPEYDEQLRAANSICDIAETELNKLAIADKCLPGAFNAACSTLLKGSYVGLHRDAFSAAPDDEDGGWIMQGDNIGLSRKNAKMIFSAGIAAYGTDEQYEKAEALLKNDVEHVECVTHEGIGLEVTSIELPDRKAVELYERLNSTETDSYQIACIQPMGRLICKPWDVPIAAPTDLPEHAKTKTLCDETSVYLIEQEVLSFCFEGMKIDCTVKQLYCGIKWIDTINSLFPSFYTWLPNESVCGKGAWKEPGPPKEWMLRQTQRSGKTSNGAVVPAQMDVQSADAAD